MQSLKNLSYAILAAGLIAGVALAQAELTQFSVTTAVHGFATAPGLPAGDLFLLPQPLPLTLQTSAGAAVFTANDETFGAPVETMGALPGVRARGFSLAMPNESALALACADSIQSGNLWLAATVGATGDTARVFLRNEVGAQELLRLVVEEAGFRLVRRHPHVRLFVDNRYALGPDVPGGALIPFVAEAGPRGRRTGLLTFSLPRDFASPLRGQAQLGLELNRAAGEGTVSVVLADLIVNRTRLAGDENNAGFGLLGQLRGGYPSGAPRFTRTANGQAARCTDPAVTTAQALRADERQYERRR